MTPVFSVTTADSPVPTHMMTFTKSCLPLLTYNLPISPTTEIIRSDIFSLAFWLSKAPRWPCRTVSFILDAPCSTTQATVPAPSAEHTFASLSQRRWRSTLPAHRKPLSSTDGNLKCQLVHLLIIPIGSSLLLPLFPASPPLSLTAKPCKACLACPPLTSFLLFLASASSRETSCPGNKMSWLLCG